MTRQDAIAILDPETRFERLAEIEYKAGFRGSGAVASAMNEALRMAINALKILDDSMSGQEAPPENKPLTPDELRNMGGKPYFHVSLQGGQSHWAILDPCYARRVEDYHYGEYWLAYKEEL